MTDSGPAIKEGGRATQTFDSTSSSKQMAWQVCCCDGIDGGCRPAASWCSGFSLATVFVVFVLESYPFLAITSPGAERYPCGRRLDAPIRDAGGSSRVRNYRHLFTTGGP